MTVWQALHIKPRVSCVLPFQYVRSPRSWQARQIALFSSTVCDWSSGRKVIMPADAATAAGLHVCRAGPVAAFTLIFAFLGLASLPISVWLNSVVSFA